MKTFRKLWDVPGLSSLIAAGHDHAGRRKPVGRVRKILHLEPLEGRSLLSTIVDLGPAYNVMAVNASGEVVGAAPAGSDSGTGEEAFYTDSHNDPQTIAPAAGYSESFANAVNGSGQIAGYDETPGGFNPAQEAYVYSQGTATALGFLGGNESVATGINASGEAVGYSNLTAFMWTKTAGMQPVPGSASGSEALAINDSGQIVGYSQPSGSQMITPNATVWTPGKTPQVLETLAGNHSEATAINNAGAIAGWSTTTAVSGGPVHAVTWSQAGTVKDLTTLPGWTDSYATAINNAGVVVGYTQGITGEPFPGHAFIYENGQMTDLNSLLPANSGWVLTTATAINDSGVIAGLGNFDNGPLHGYEFFPSTSPPNTIATTTALQASSLNPVHGQPITLTATVSAVTGGSGVPAGTVAFFDGSAYLGSGSLSNGTVSLPISTLPVGNDPMTASYSADSPFAGSTSPTVDVNVQKDGTLVSIMASAQSSGVGNAFTFAASVSPATPGGGTPTGSIMFMDNGQALATVTLSNGVAALPAVTLPTGQNLLSAYYSGDSGFLAASSVTLSEPIQPPVLQFPTRTSLTASARSLRYGQKVKLTVTVKSKGGTPAGEVEFIDGTIILGTPALSRGKVGIKTSDLHLGTNTIEAIYIGAGGFTKSSASVRVSVKQSKPVKPKAHGMA